MLEIEEAAKKSYEEQCHEETSAYECFFHYTDQKLYSAGFNEGILYAQHWIPIKERLPRCFESGSWDGLRSEWCLVKNKEGDWFKARLYSGVMDGSEFNDWYDDDYFQLNNITHFRQIQILI